MDRTILHSDCNSFFASVECAKKTELKKYPVSVGGDAESRHGVILASNMLAKKYGVKTGEALWQAKKKCPDLIVVKPDFDSYLEFSYRVSSIYNDYTDRIEQFGIDEAWLDLTSRYVENNGKYIAEEIRRRVKNELGITVSIGVSFNKIFAKLGSDYKKPDAVTEISRLNYREIVYPLPVSDLFMVGSVTAKKLRNSGIFTIGDIAETPVSILESILGKAGQSLSLYANGMDLSPVLKKSEKPAEKSVGNSVTTPRDMTNINDVKVVFTALSQKISRRLNDRGMYGETVEIMLRDTKLKVCTHRKKLLNPISSADNIAETAMELFLGLSDKHFPLRGVGITISGLSSENVSRQLNFFMDIKKDVLGQEVMRINKKYGTGTVKNGILMTASDLYSAVK